MRRPLRLIAGLGGVAAVLTSVATVLPATAQSDLPVRAAVAMVAADGLPSRLPPPDPSYCFPGSGPGSTPPSSIFGTLTIGGQPAPAGTIVQTVFDGKVGPARATSEAGGYRLDYHAGGASCSNKAGAAIGVLVSGLVIAAPVKVGDAVTAEPYRFDIAIP